MEATYVFRPSRLLIAMLLLPPLFFVYVVLGGNGPCDLGDGSTTTGTTTTVQVTNTPEPQFKAVPGSNNPNQAQTNQQKADELLNSIPGFCQMPGAQCNP